MATPLGRLVAFTVAAFAIGCNAGDDIPPPTLSMLSPSHAPPGAVVMILGAYFCQQLASGDDDPLRCDHTGSVSFGTAPGTIGSYADHMISVEVPSLGAGRVAVSVTVAGRLSNRVDFDIDAP